MFQIRERSSENIGKRQQRKFYEISATGLNIPLPMQEELWSTRSCTLPIDAEHFQRLYEFEVQDDDVYVVTFPKCGTTWTQEAVWLLMNSLDFQKANELDLSYRSVFMDLSAIYTNIPRNTIELAKQAKAPRVLKSHLPAHLLPKQIWEKKSKIIYCARNPKDMAVSYFHFHRGLGTWQGDISEFVEDLINDDIIYSPYWDHMVDFWQMRLEPNIFFTTFEEMKRDLRTVLIKLNRFLEKPELNDSQLQQLLQHLSFENMKANRHTNPTLIIKSSHGSNNVRQDFEFMRRGIVGSFKDELSAEDQAKLDQWIRDNLAKHNIELKDIFGEI